MAYRMYRIDHKDCVSLHLHSVKQNALLKLGVGEVFYIFCSLAARFVSLFFFSFSWLGAA
jgi:hypothetical protein